MGYRTNIFSIDNDKVQEFKNKFLEPGIDVFDIDIYDYLKNEYDLGDYNVKSELPVFVDNYYKEIKVIEDVKTFIFNIIKSFQKDIMKSYEDYENSEFKTKRFLRSRKIFWESSEHTLDVLKDNDKKLFIGALGILEFEIFELMSIYNNLDKNKTYLLISG